MTEPGVLTYREILSQPEAWEATLAVQEEALKLRPWLESGSATVAFTGCGSTHYLSLTAAALWQALTGRPARGWPASELWLLPDQSLLRHPSLLVAISRSGETSETLHAVDRFRAAGGERVLALSCYGGRPLAARATEQLLARGAEEESVAQTRSFTSMLLLVHIIAATVAGNREHLAQLATLPARARALTGQYEGLARRLATDPAIERYVFLGSGANYGLACEAMLKMKEMSLSPAEAFHTLEFRHGPKSVVGRDMLAVALLDDRAREQELAVLAELRNLGARVMVIGPSAAEAPADYRVDPGSAAGGLVRTPLYLPILQLLAYYRARHKGLNPDRPRNLESVVRLDRSN